MKLFYCIKFCDKKWIEVNVLSGSHYSIRRNIRLKNPTLRSNLCDYSDAYVVLKGRINLKVYENDDLPGKHSALENNAPFRPCIIKINNILKDNAEDLDVVMLMYIVC